MFTNINLRDMETDYKAFRREIIQGIIIEENRFSFEPEMSNGAGVRWITIRSFSGLSGREV